MFSKLSITILALAFFLQAAVAFPWGWHAHPTGFPGFNGTGVAGPTGTGYAKRFPTAWGTGLPTGYPTGTGYPVPTGGYYAKRSEEGLQHAKRFEGPRQAEAYGYYPIEGGSFPEGPFPTDFPTSTGTGYPFPTGTGVPYPTGY